MLILELPSRLGVFRVDVPIGMAARSFVVLLDKMRISSARGRLMELASATCFISCRER